MIVGDIVIWDGPLPIESDESPYGTIIELQTSSTRHADCLVFWWEEMKLARESSYHLEVMREVGS